MHHFAYKEVDWRKVFQRISDGRRGIMTQIARELGMSKSQLSRIWTKHQSDDNFDPGTMQWGGHLRTFTDDEEQMMVDFLIKDLASDGLAMPEEEIRRICHDHWSSQHPHATRQNSFNASNGWVYNFKNRNHLSGRVSSRERKNDPDDEEVAAYMEEMREVHSIFPAHRIYNSDETPVKIAPTKCFTTQIIGQPTPAIHRISSVKDIITAIATIRANGDKLPLTIVAKGTTPRCVKNLDLPDDIRRAFTPSGKVNEEIAMQHIEQISEWSKKEPAALVWDSYGAHTTENVYDCAFAHKVRLVIVPKNSTPTKQPLDFGVFGEVSQRHQAMLRKGDVLTMAPLEAKKRSIALYAKAWDKVAKRTVRKAWKCTM